MALMLVFGVAVAHPQDAASPASLAAVAKVCPTCKHTFAATDRFCPIDGVPLADAPAKRDRARVCPRCQRTYDSSARYCSADGAPLKTIDGAAAPPGAATAGAAAKTISQPSGSEAATTNERATVATGLTGSAYVSALRASLVAPVESRATLEATARELAERFRLERRIVAAVSFEAAHPKHKELAARLQRDLAARLSAAEMRDLELQSPNTLDAQLGWKKLLIDGGVLLDRDDDMNVRISLAVRDAARGRDQPREDFAGTLDVAAQADRSADPIVSLTEQLAAAVLQRVRRQIDSQFAEARQLARDGHKSRAVETYVRFLFATPDFDTPQADEANEYVVAALHFSVLDWLWGDPDIAIVGGHRRLPIGFRSTSGPSATSELPPAIMCLRDGSEMVLVPGGTELMGDDAGPTDSRPAHPATLKPFYIDKRETSVAQYERFVNAAGHRTPAPDEVAEPRQFSGRAAKPELRQLPVVHVDWYDATRFAQWSGKSLPTEGQWERAARGRFAPDYPRSVDVNFAKRTNARQDALVPNQLTSVFSFPTALNPHGCLNMLGNAAEWCRDWYDPSFYAGSPSHEPLGPDSGSSRVVRGGSWQTPVDELTPTRRSAMPPTQRSGAVGFRCVLNLPNGSLTR
jgi:formylglycine-generating enzyme required for sulfatase activity